MSGWRELPFTPHRQVVYDLLARARRFHAPVTGSFELDVTRTRDRIRGAKRDGQALSFIAYLVRATAMIVAKHPELRRHLFTTWWGRPRDVAFERISCTLIVARRAPGGEEILLPVLIPDVDRLSIEQLHALVQHHRSAPVEELEPYRAFERVKAAPRLALRWFSYKARSDPEFYQRYFGLYGLSSLMDPRGAENAMATYANTAVAFLPGTLRERPWVVGGEIVPRTILNLSVVFDHYLLDGAQMARVHSTLRALLEEPERVLGPEGASA